MKVNNFLDDSSESLCGKVLAIYSLLFVLNIGAWLSALAAFREHPVILGTAFLAYSLGLRHAVDADHIAAIDNVTRKLMEDGKRPVGIGLMFSLGHSTTVLIGAAALAGAALLLQNRVSAIKSVAGLIGTVVSAVFLFAIAAVNLIVFRSVYRAFVKMRSGGRLEGDGSGVLFANPGFLSGVLRPIFRLVNRSWHMYPLGVLFGLGFDTATEIGVLSISAGGAARGLSFSTILIFPVLFAAGMSLVDTTDNILMLGAYGWAFTKPVRRLYYNMAITCVSAVVALAIGGIEVLSLLASRFRLYGRFWSSAKCLNDDFGLLGYCIIGLFVISWLVSVVVYKLRGFDKIEASKQMPVRG